MPRFFIKTIFCECKKKDYKKFCQLFCLVEIFVYNKNMIKSEFVLEKLWEMFPNPKCELKFEDNYELIVAVILSAQCTDKRVNIVTKKLFNKFPTVFALAGANVSEVEEIIKPCGLFHAKAKNIVSMSKDVVEKFGGVVPNNFDKLITLAGVGRKTANVVLGVGFGGNTIAVDTHVFRVSNRLGIVNAKDVLECERQLQKKFAPKDWTNLHYMLVLFGRYQCTARQPKCDSCPFWGECKYRRKYVSGQSENKD